MISSVIKRDKTVVQFDVKRIIEAVEKSRREEFEEGFAENLALNISRIENEELTVDEIQDMVESVLMKSSYEQSAKAYITYRRKRDIERDTEARNIRTFNELVEIEDNNLKNDNANMNGNTPAGQMMKFASISTNDYAENYLIDPEFVKAHKRGSIHIHDKDYMPTKTTTCVQYDLDKLFKGGFNTGHGFLREPNNIRSAFALTAIAFQTNQNEQHGGQSVPALDYLLAPYVAKSFKKHFAKYFKIFKKEYPGLWATLQETDEIAISNVRLKDDYCEVYEQAYADTVEETEQAAEAFIANMNSMHSRGGNQVVFSSVNYGTDTSEEGRMIMFALLKATERGLGKGETPIFPIQIFKVKNGLSFSDEDYALASTDMDAALAGKMTFKTRNFDLFLRSCQVSSKRLFPNFAFLDTPFNVNPLWKEEDPGRARYEVTYMGCRTRVFANRFGEMSSWGRGNLSFTTMNLPRIAIEASLAVEKQFPGKTPEWKTDAKIALFNANLVEVADLSMRQLHDRYLFQCTAKAKQFPFLMGQGIWMDGEKLSPNERVADLLKHGTLSLGFIGLAEALVMLTGRHHGESEGSQKLGLEIISFIKMLCDDYSEKYDLNYTCLATPAEGLSGRFTALDRKEFGIIPGVTDREYYTNSNHVPVYYKISAYEKIKIEAPYHAMTNAGHIAYVEMDTEAKKNILAYVMLVKHMKDSHCGYASINHPVDRCIDCGHESEMEDTCPKCGSENVDKIRRITGYLVGSLSRWNSYKKAEEKDRVKHGL